MKTTQRRRDYIKKLRKNRKCAKCETPIWDETKYGMCWKCFYQSKKEVPHLVVCQHCGKEFGVEFESQIKRRTFCSRACANLSPRIREGRRIRATIHGKSYEMMDERGAVMKKSEYIHFRNAVLARDGCCVLCGATNELHVDHILPYRLFPDKVLDVDNARVLCGSCHRATWTYGRLDRNRFKTKARISSAEQVGEGVYRLVLTLPRTEFELGILMNRHGYSLVDVEVKNV